MSENEKKLEWPRYKASATVRALKIATAVFSPDGEALLTPEDTTYEAFVVDMHFAQKFQPSNGGYFVVFEIDEATKCDTWWTAEAFEQVFGEPVDHENEDHRTDRVRLDTEQHGRTKIAEARPHGVQAHSNTRDTHTNKK